MNQLEFVITVAVCMTLAYIFGYFVGKRKRKVPENQVVVERITHEYLLERDELLTHLQEDQQYEKKSPVMYVVKDYVWSN